MAAEKKDEQQIALAKSLNHVPWSDQYERMISGMLWVERANLKFFKKRTKR